MSIARPVPVLIKPEPACPPDQFESQKPLTMAAGSSAFTPRC